MVLEVPTPTVGDRRARVSWAAFIIATGEGWGLDEADADLASTTLARAYTTLTTLVTSPHRRPHQREDEER